MDNITHSMAGWVLGQAGLKTKTRKGLAALILGANMPDIDVFFGAAPWDPLATHRGFTHGLVGGAVLMPPVLAGLLWLLDRWQAGRGKPFESGLSMRFGWLLALCYLGTLTHPLLDVLTTYSVQLFSPFSTDWYHSDGLFIIDLFLWLLFAGSLIWSKRRERNGGDWRRPAQAAVAITLAYVGVNLAITNRANAAVENWADGREYSALFASPPPVYFWQRGLVWREDHCYRRARYDPFGGGFGSVGRCEPTNMDDPLVIRAIRSDPGLRKFLKWSILPQADIERRQCSVRVWIGDARYGQGRRSRLGRSAVIPSDAPGCQPGPAAQ